MLGEGKQFTFSQVPIDLNYNYSPGDNQRGDGECQQGSPREMFLSPSQANSINRVTQGVEVGSFFGGVNCLLHQSFKRAKGRREPAAEGSRECQIHNGQSSLAHRETPGPLTLWPRLHHHALKPAHPRAATAQRPFREGAWSPQFQISWLSSICPANSILSPLKRLLISFLNNKNVFEVVIKMYVYLPLGIG